MHEIGHGLGLNHTIDSAFYNLSSSVDNDLMYIQGTNWLAVKDRPCTLLPPSGTVSANQANGFDAYKGAQKIKEMSSTTTTVSTVAPFTVTVTTVPNFTNSVYTIQTVSLSRRSISTNAGSGITARTVNVKAITGATYQWQYQKPSTTVPNPNAWTNVNTVTGETWFVVNTATPYSLQVKQYANAITGLDKAKVRCKITLPGTTSDLYTSQIPITSEPLVFNQPHLALIMLYGI
jgi:hypothetical protein